MQERPRGAGHVQAAGNHKQQQPTKMKFAAAAASSAKKPVPLQDAVYEFERKIPMQSSILEAQKFKTVIFVNGN